MTLSESEFETRARRIRLIVSDVDGVLTDGSVVLDAQGQEIKRFNILDGFGVRCWQRSGHTFAVLTGRTSGAVTQRCRELEIEHVIQGKGDKVPAYEGLLAEMGLDPSAVCYIGDDFPDLPLLMRSGIGACVVNAVPEVREHADWISATPGGSGAVRELVVALLTAQGRWQEIVRQYTKTEPSSARPPMGAG
jgi:3-deoxy-D-manno-octulosonate 8-phosphate phosphatase (KDO 8-P phosphatase)